MRFVIHEVTAVKIGPPKMVGDGRWVRSLVIWATDDQGTKECLDLDLIAKERQALYVVEDYGDG